MMLKCKRQEASLVTVAAENAGLYQGCVHFSKASRSDESSLPIRSWRTLVGYCHPIATLYPADMQLRKRLAAAAFDAYLETNGLRHSVAV